MSHQFDELRRELDSLGYPQKLHPESVPLVKKLLGDLDITTTNLQKYMKISQHALEEKDLLESAAEPYKCDNAKLIKECNDLHLAFIHFKEQHERIQRDLRKQLSGLQNRLDNCNSEKQSLIKEIQQLNRDKMRKGSKSQEIGKEKDLRTKISTEKKTVEELNDLKGKYQRVVEDNAILQNQLTIREDEIKRLQSKTESGRSLKELDSECCYKNFDNKIRILQEEMNRLKIERDELQLQTEEALAKQHEAMRRALHLLERNKQLEKEIREMDEIALTVERQCNNTMKSNSQKVVSLERENSSLKQSKLQLKAELEAVRLEKCHIQKQLEFEVEDKKKLTDRINNYTIIENDLNLEIDRLTRLNAEQKLRIAELESEVGGDRLAGSRSNEQRVLTVDSVTQANEMSNRASQTTKGVKPSKLKGDSKKLRKYKSPTKIDPPSSVEAVQKCCCDSGNCIKNFRELLDKELEFRQATTMQSLETLKEEKEYFMKEYHKVLEQLRNIPVSDASDKVMADLKQQLREKEAVITRLETQMQLMTKERSHLMMDNDSGGFCTNPNCKRREREMKIQKDELRHVEMENNTLKTKLQTLNETTLFNEERMKKAFQDMEEHIRKLEDERRDLVKAEVSHRSNVSHLEEEYRAVKEQLRLTQAELSGLRTSYNQLKLLHEQTDRALSEAQGKMLRAETELAEYQSRAKDSSRETALHDREITKLSSDVQIMRNQMSKLDREKDDLLNKLDEKTEQNASLEDQLTTRNKSLGNLEAELKELKRKLSKYADESSSQDHLVRSKQQELAHLEQDFDRERKSKEAALLENKRLQNDLTCVAADCRDARNELEISKRQIEDLKRQLQQYVAEVKRTEDLISQKEMERGELLDQFKSLSQEHDVLESNNHTLSNEAIQSRIQLSVALDHTSELERKIENQESIIKSYEKQITDLTAQVASLEIQLKQEGMAQERSQSELKHMRDLCVKLDKDKDMLRHELTSKEDVRSQAGKASEKLRSEKEYLEKALEKERTSLEGLERLLNEARQEVVDQRLLNQDLQNEVGSLKNKLVELQERLTVTSDQLDIYQEKALDYSQQNKQLRREIANERHEKIINLERPEPESISNSNNYKANGALSGCHERCRRVQYATDSTSEDDQRKFQKNTGGHDTDNHVLKNIVEGKSSIHSTKSLHFDGRRFHGSDGILDGNTDLLRLRREDQLDASRQISLTDGLLRHLPRTKSTEQPVIIENENEIAGSDVRALQGSDSDAPDAKKNGECARKCNKSFVAIAPRRCKCQTCLMNTSTSEPNLQKNRLSVRTICEKKDDKIKNSHFKVNDDNKPNKQTRSKHKEITRVEKPDEAGRTRTQAEFDRESDSTATFRKVFSIDGVGLECRCCISSFKD